MLISPHDDKNPDSSPQPMGVTVVAILLLIGALFSVLSIAFVYTSPTMRSYIYQTTSSVPLLVFLTLINAGLSITCGIGLLNGRNWARMLYIGFMPIFMLLAMTNGFVITMLVSVVQYIIFVIVLMRPDVSEYFHREAPRHR